MKKSQTKNKDYTTILLEDMRSEMKKLELRFKKEILEVKERLEKIENNPRMDKKEILELKKEIVRIEAKFDKAFEKIKKKISIA